MPRILYLSYGRRDSREFAKRLSSWLRLLGYDPWLDTEHGGTQRKPLKPEAEAAIKSSTFLIAILSQESVHADGVAREELRCALANHIPVLPVKIADIALPSGIAHHNCLDASADPGSVFTLLPALIDQILEKAKNPKNTKPGSLKKPWWDTGRRRSIIRHLKHLGGRFTGRDWLFELIKNWAGEKDSRILILSGDPGIGKSAIAARLATQMDVKGFFVFDPGEPETLNPEYFVRTLAFQFAGVFPSYREKLECLGEPDASSPPEEVFRTHIAEPLGACSDRPGTGDSWFLVLDGLDDALAGGDTGTIDFLAESLVRLPPWFRVIATTKNDPDILERFRGTGIRQLTINASSVDNRADLDAYIRLRTAGAGTGTGRILDVVDRIGTAAAGNFSFARAALDAEYLPGITGQAADEARMGFEANLHRQYLQMIRGRFPATTTYKSEIAPALACLAVAQSPVPERLLLSAVMQKRRAVVKKLDTPETNAPPAAAKNSRLTYRRMLRALSPFMVRDNDRLRLFHRSFAEWLCGWWNIPNPCAISWEEGNRRLADACLQELREKKADVSDHVLYNIVGYLLRSKVGDHIPEVLANPHYITGVGRLNYEGLRILWAEIEEHNREWRMQTLYGPVIEDPTGFDRTFVDLVARLLVDAGHHDDALALYRALEVIFTEKRERARSAGAMNRQADILLRRGSLAQAQALLETAVRIQRKSRNTRGCAYSLSCLGKIHHIRGDFTRAMKMFLEQERLCSGNGDVMGILDAMSSQVLVMRSRGELEQAEKILERQTAFRQDHRIQTVEARARGIEALILLDQGELRYAMHLLLEQETQYRRLGDWIAVGECLANQGFILQADGEYDRALEIFRQEADTCWEQGDRYGLARAFGHRGCVFLSLGKIDEAIALFMEQEEISRELDYQRELAVSFANQSLVRHRQKNPAAAERLAGTALALAREQGDVDLISRIQSVLAEIKSGKE